MSISNKDYFNKLTSKAEKSLEGIDADCYMKNLRDDSSDKEEAEELQKAIENLKKAMKDAYNKTIEDRYESNNI